MPGSVGERIGSTLRSAVPLVEWLPDYERSWLRRDVFAGITVTASVIPEGLAYASLANLPPVTGLYAGLLAAATYVVCGTSRQVIVGPTSALAILLATGVGTVAAGNAMSYGGLVVWTTVLVGLFGVVAWLLRLGFLVHFISDSVLTGFATGAALYIMSTQLGPLLGIEGAGGVFFERLWYIGTNLGEASLLTAAVGLSGIIVLAVGERGFPRVPVALLVVLASILLSAGVDLQQRGVDIVGPIPSGLPSLTVPALPSSSTLGALVPVAGALFLLSYVQGIGAIETFAREHDYAVDANQELLSVGVANLAAGFGGGFAVGGSMSRSALNDSVGGRTQIASAVVAAGLVVVLLFLTGVFTALPETILAAVVVTAVTSLIDAAGLRRLAQASRTEFAIAVAVLLGVLGFGMLWGVFIGVFLSLVVVIARVSDPNTEVLERLPGTDTFVERDRHPTAEPVAGVFVYRVEAPLFYANASGVRADLLDRLDAEDTAASPISLVVFDLVSSPGMDVTAGETLGDLAADLDDRGIALRVAGAEPSVVRLLETLDLDDHLGPVEEEESVSSVIQRWRDEGGEQ